MVNRTKELLRLRAADPVVDDIMEVFTEASEVHEQALIALGQKAVPASSPVASTEVVVNFASDLSSRQDLG